MISAAIAAAALASIPAGATDLAAVEAALRSVRAGGPRAAAATRAFVTAPYIASPLGEGEGPDPDPRFRLDAFDCMTLVETAVALGSASSLEEARLALDDVRYADSPEVASRNHEVLSQWIPRNVAKGWIADVGREVGGPVTRKVEKEYTRESWAVVRASGRAIRHLPRARLPLGRFSLDVIPAADVAAVSARVPEGAIAFVVRSDAPDRPSRVTHAALVVLGRGGARLVRHATSSKGVRRIIEEPLERFVRREQRAHPRWPLDGVAFFAIRSNGARVRALAAGARAAAAPHGEGPPALPPPRP
jgi:hypothetical protein